jgi:hypothetical protein
MLDRHPGVRILLLSGYAEKSALPYGVLEAGLWFIPQPFKPPVPHG